MKKSIFLVCCLVLSFCLFAKKKEIVPPGTVYYKSNLYVDATEISNLSWQEYVFWLKKNKGEDSESYKSAIPDTAVWSSDVSYTEPFKKFYFKHWAYRNYPVVGISYEQALAYCKWRTEVVNRGIYLSAHKMQINDTIKEPIPVVVTYRLPLKEELEEIAKIGYSDKILKKVDKKHLYLHNSRRHDKIDAANNDSTLDITAPVNAYFPNKMGVYNIIGNVAEMTMEKGIAKGGGWIHNLEESESNAVQEYHCPQAWLGFRCIAEVK